MRCLQHCDISRFRRLKLSKNYRLIQKEPRLQGEKARERGLSLFSFLDKVSVCEKAKLFQQTETRPKLLFQQAAGVFFVS